MLKLILSSEKYHCDKKLSLEVLCTMTRDLFGKSNGTLIFTCGFDSWKLKFQKRPIISSGLAQGCFSLNIQNRKNDAFLFSLRNIKILTNMQKFSIFELRYVDRKLAEKY
jgi:hypothetical protein